MKRHLILATILALCAISCHKQNNPQPPPSNGYFRGKVDGVFFSDSVWAHISTPTDPMWGPIETIIEGRDSDLVITLRLPAFITTGERLLNQATVDAIRITDYGTGGSFLAGFNGYTGSPAQGSGKINILEITSSYMRGTFECIAPPTDSAAGIFPPIYITEGEFKLKSY
jgi:hypothetical protein